MSDKVKVTARKRFFLGGRNVGPGEIEVPAERVERLVLKGLIDAPEGTSKVASAPAAPTSDELPEDFPVRDLLTGSAFKTLGALREASDEELLAVDGIGQAKLKQIREALR